MLVDMELRLTQLNQESIRIMHCNRSAAFRTHGWNPDRWSCLSPEFSWTFPENSLGVAAAAVTEKWQVCNQLGGPRASAIAQSEKAQHMRLVPWAGVAARLSTSAKEGGGKDEVSPVRGGAYCFLPLPVNTGLPVHVNGYFELSSNR